MSAGRPARLAVGVVSAGRVGAVVGAALAAAGHRVVAASGVSRASVTRAEALLPGVPLVPPDEAAALHERMAASMKTLSPTGWTERVVHPSGEVRWVETRTRFLAEAGGKLLVFGQSFDVTEQKRSEYLHREALDALPAVVFAMTPEGEFPIYNRAAQEYVGPHPKLRGNALEHRFELISTDGVTPFPRENTPMIRALHGEDAPEAEMIFRDPILREDSWLHIKGRPVRDELGNIIAGGIVPFIAGVLGGWLGERRQGSV